MSWKITALRGRAKTEPNARPKTIHTSARAPQGSRVLRARKTLRNVPPTNPAYTGNASTRMDRMRKYTLRSIVLENVFLFGTIIVLKCLFRGGYCRELINGR